MDEHPMLPRRAELPRLAGEAGRRGDWATALARWEECIGMFPDAPAVSGWRGARANALLHLGHSAAAEDAFASLVRDHPELETGFAGLARLAHQGRHWQVARLRWEACLQRFPASPAAPIWRCSRAAALLELGLVAEAEATLLALVQADPPLPAALSGLAKAAQLRGDLPLAVERWDACLTRFPGHPAQTSWRTTRATLLEGLDRWEAAHRAWDELARDGGEDVQTEFRRIRSLFEWHGPTAAVEGLASTVVERHPDNLPALRLYARIAAHRGDTGTALQRYLRCIAQYPSEIDLYQRAMEAALRLGDLTIAEEILAKAPAKIVETIGFACRVRLSFLTLKADIEAGLALIGNLDEALLDQPSAAAIGRFLHYAIRDEQLLRFSGRMLARFVDSPVFIGQHLLALCHVRGKEIFEREKARLLAPLSDRDTALVLGGLPPPWLSPAEARRLIDDSLAKPWGAVPKRHALLHWAHRRDPEILACVAERLAAGEAPLERFLARSVLTSVEDRRRIATANLGGCGWREFQAASAALRQELDGLVAAAEPGTMPELLADALAKARRVSHRAKAAWPHSADSYGDAVAFVAWLLRRVRRKEPTSVIRLNDGEGVFLPYPRAHLDFQDADRRTFQQIWWGEERIKGPEASSLVADYRAAVLRADAIGVPTPRWLIAHLGVPTVRYTARGLTAVLAFMDLLPAPLLRRKVITSSHIHIDLEYWDLYRQLLVAGSSVSIVSCHDLAPRLAERFGIAVRQWHRIAPEYKYARMFDEAAHSAAEPFYPAEFARIMGAVAPLPGEICLVAAGFLGKLICDRVRARGGIGIDIGSAADLWMGHATRWVTGGHVDFDIASSLIAEQPIRDRFRISEISLEEPCRSDRTRRLNLTGAFTRSTVAAVRLAAPQPHALRVIGHPRCGGDYIARVLNSLGLELGHERPGRDGVCGWIYAVDDLNPPSGEASVAVRAFRTTLAFVRDPAAAIPAIMVENCLGASFDFRRFHIARHLGIDVAQYRTPLERAVACYLLWMRIVDDERPALTLHVERLFEDLSRHASVLAEAGIRPDPARQEAAASISYDREEAGPEFEAARMASAAAHYRLLSADLAGLLGEFCRRHQYPWPGGQAADLAVSSPPA
jgi:tetratricopeptide (TPR) repeat protein